MPNIGPMELMIVLVIALIVLGPAKLPQAGRSMGEGLRAFKRALSGSGATGSGKTTVVNVAAGLIPDQERILTLEDTPELQTGHFRAQSMHTSEEGAREAAATHAKVRSPPTTP